MCKLKSWVEYNGQILHLTDLELRDKVIKERLKDCRDNDLIGHGAIRQAFNLPLNKGVDMEADFWKIDKLPKEIAKTFKEFDKYYSYLFSNCMSNDDLRDIINNAPEPYQAKASEQLLKQKPSNDDLRYIVDYALEPYKAKAWEQLLKQKPSNDDLRDIVNYAPEPYKAKTWEQLLKQKPSNYDLLDIVVYAPEPYKAKAKKLLKE